MYKKETSPVFDYYEQSGKSKKVDGLGSIEEIFGRLCQPIDQLS